MGFVDFTLYAMPYGLIMIWIWMNIPSVQSIICAVWASFLSLSPISSMTVLFFLIGSIYLMAVVHMYLDYGQFNFFVKTCFFHNQFVSAAQQVLIRLLSATFMCFTILEEERSSLAR